eukprot:scaffold1397_cov254-Pinguiococcus_pyrenoidosus.AAC.56
MKRTCRVLIILEPDAPGGVLGKGRPRTAGALEVTTISPSSMSFRRLVWTSLLFTPDPLPMVSPPRLAGGLQILSTSSTYTIPYPAASTSP